MDYRLAANAILEDVDDTLVILLDNGDAAVFNQIGKTIITELLDSGFDSAVSHTTCNYDVSQEKALVDIRKFADRLIALKLIEEVPCI